MSEILNPPQQQIYFQHLLIGCTYIFRLVRFIQLPKKDVISHKVKGYTKTHEMLCCQVLLILTIEDLIMDTENLDR